MDKDKLFDNIENELNHYCRFTCDKYKLMKENDLCGYEVCDICQVNNFIEYFKREIQVDKL